jgi:hypothetical protein
MIIISVTFIFLVLGLFIQLFKNKFNYKPIFWAKILYFSSVTFIFSYYLGLTVVQYFVWKNGGSPTIYFLPPYENIFYLINYHFIRFGLYYLISLIVSFMFLYFARHYNKNLGERFFQKEEIYLGALTIFLLGNFHWNFGWLWYLILVCFVSLLISLIREKVLKIKERLPLYYLWLPVGILVIIINILI